MQQTRIGHGTAYFKKFIRRFPSIRSLAAAKENEVLKLWEGLGYYSRARNLLSTARQIHLQFDDKFPESFETLTSLKGIGSYTASAILSFAFGKPYPVIDANVLRIYSRLRGVQEPVDAKEGKKKIEIIAEELLDRENPGKFNQAIMDFGALVCTPVFPECNRCPLRQNCFAWQNDLTTLLPIKSKSVRRTQRRLNYIVITDGAQVVIEKRTGQDIWKHLFQFPVYESKDKIKPEELQNSVIFKQLLGRKSYTLLSVKQLSQELTHQRIVAQFYLVKVNQLGSPGSRFQKCVSFRNLKKYAFPGVIRNYLKEIPNFNN